MLINYFSCILPDSIADSAKTWATMAASAAPMATTDPSTI